MVNSFPIAVLAGASLGFLSGIVPGTGHKSHGKRFSMTVDKDRIDDAIVTHKI